MNRIRSDLIGISFHEIPPAPANELSARDKHCHFIGRAREGESFYISAENIACPLARFHLGIEEPDLKRLARTLVDWTDAVDEQTGLKFLNSAVRMGGSYRYILYFTYPHPHFKADVLIRICRPDEAQRIIQKFASLTGEAVESRLSGIGAACGECTAYVVTKQAPAVSVGCNGSRPRIGLEECELLLAAPFGSKMCDLMIGQR